MSQLGDEAVSREPAADPCSPGPGYRARRAGSHLDLDDLVWARSIYSIDGARTVLGYHPRFDFTAFIDAWRRGNRDHYPFANEPWWGAERP